MVVQHNIPAMNANRYFNVNNSGLSKSLEKLSSGYAINRAGDNAAGLAVSEKMRSQIAGLTQGVKNAQDGISMIQTYEGALDETDKILQRMKTLATQSANGTYQNDVDREAIQLEFDQLNDELDQIADTDFNGVVMLNGGEMADGTKADATGKIDYSTATRQAQQVGTAGGFVKGIGTATYAGTNTETVTFTATKNADGTVSWEASDGALGTVANGTDKTGGFSYDGATVVVDTNKIVSGDTITISFDKKVNASGQVNDTVGVTEDLGKTGGVTTTKAGISITATDANVTSQEIADALNALNGTTIEETYAKDGTAPTAASTKINGVAINGASDAAPIEIGKVGEGSLIMKAAGVIAYKSKDGTVQDIAKYTESAMTGKATNAGTVTTKVYVGEAKFTPASDKSVKLVEPDGKVSQANSNDASTAVLNYTDNMTLQAGARTKDSVNFTFNYESNGIGELKANMNCSSRSDGLGTKDLSLATQESANSAIDKIDNAINKVSMVRASFGATQNRLEHKIDNMNVTKENITSAESRIRDTDMAAEMTNFTKNQILSQASQAMLAQANQLPQGVLQLLG